MLQAHDDAHFPDEVFERFVLDKLQGAEFEQFESHLLCCESCVMAVERAETEIAVMKMALEKFESRHSLCTEKQAPSPLWRNVFISHGGRFMGHVERLAELLPFANFCPVVAKFQPDSLSPTVNQKVQNCARLCRFAVVLATEETATAPGKTRDNILHEIGMLQAMKNIGNRIVYMKEPGVELASNYRDKIWISFRKSRIQDSFLRLLRELKALQSQTCLTGLPPPIL